MPYELTKLYGTEVAKITEKKIGNKWVEESRTNDKEQVYRELARRLISKKLRNCQWITSIKYDYCYDGTDKIKITYDNGYRDVFVVEDK